MKFLFDTFDCKEQRNKKQQTQIKITSPNIQDNSLLKYNLRDIINDKKVVYFIGDVNGTYVKIGVTESILSLSHRFRTIQGCSPLKLKLLGFIQTIDNYKLEKELHKKYKAKGYHRHGEWFIRAPEIDRYITSNCIKIDLANTLFGETYINLETII